MFEKCDAKVTEFISVPASGSKGGRALALLVELSRVVPACALHDLTPEARLQVHRRDGRELLKAPGALAQEAERSANMALYRQPVRMLRE